MKSHMTLVILVLLALSACSVPGISDDESPTHEASSETSATPSEETIDAESIVGDWTAEDTEWTVHFHEDGTFVEDFQGFEDFRVGRYTLDDDEVTLVGDDGNSDVGTIEDNDTLKFKLGTLTQEDED